MNARHSCLPLMTLMALNLPLESVSAHGYVSNPPARGWLCKQGGNTGCGPVQWEPQSLEGFSGFPGTGPADGRIASAGLTQFRELNEQTSSRWSRTPIQAGPLAFTWNFTANHVTRNWRYYITRDGWNPNLPLSRSSFESAPFCTANGNQQRPPMTLVHDCHVPARTGYQVILAVWEVGDTPMSFYNVIDVLFKGGDPPPPAPTWEVKGTIHPTTDLASGDSVRTRVFDGQGERADLQTRLDISSEEEGKALNWSYHLAERINVEQVLLKAGQLGADGTITPVYGANGVHARSDSGISAVEVQIDKAPPPSLGEILVEGVKPRYPISQGAATIDYTLTAKGDLDITSTVFDAGGVIRAYATLSLNEATQVQSLKVRPARPGVYSLVVKAVVKPTGDILQKTFTLRLGAEAKRYDFVFPKGLKRYQAGTRVLQPRDGLIYECRPWPNTGYCVQWSPTATQFEPGFGSHWPEAWIQR